MTSIDWRNTQQKLLSIGYNPGPVDGLRGRMTFTALFSYMAKRAPDAALRAIGNASPSALGSAGIDDSPGRLGDFLAQTCHETGGYSRFEENLRYSAKRLMAVWPGRFRTPQMAAPYAYDPTDPDREDVALANLVYGARMGNEADGTADDDGWDHRGRGMLQHTGAGEYELLRKRLGLEPDDVADPGNALKAAADYWTRRRVNSFCDRGDFRGSRRAVNGGSIGLAEVNSLRTRAFAVIQ